MGRIRTIAAAACVAWATVAVPPAAAQTDEPAAGPPEGQIEADPIRCWWRTDRTAIGVGERFGLLVTCAVIEVGSITVVPELNQLEPGALSITPYEVVSGTRGDDVVAPPWRYVQFAYRVRLLNDGFFGQEVPIPALTVTYNLQAAGGTQGRDQTYQLPALPMRVLSLVPAAATDIRDSSGQTFDAVGTRRFRSSLALVVAVIAFAFAAAFAVFAVVRAVGRYRATRAVTARRLPVPAVLGACLETLSDVSGAATRDGWTPDLARRAVAALRVAGAVALGRPVAQQFTDLETAPRDGQLAARAGWLRRERVLLSASVTARTIDGRADNGRKAASDPASLVPIGEALDRLSIAAYSRTNGAGATTDLDGTLRSAVDAVRRLRSRTRWPLRTVDAVMRSIPGLG